MRVLIIESDVSFASTLRQALEARGVEVATTSDGKKGMELAKAHTPAAIVLAVELGDRLTGGFSWCNKFKRDAELRSIPLVLTSSLATAETFEEHRKLKTRADDYLLKPFGPRALVELLGPYFPQPPAPEDDGATFDLAEELLKGFDDEAAPGASAAAAVEILDANDLIDEIFDEVDAAATSPADPGLWISTSGGITAVEGELNLTLDGDVPDPGVEVALDDSTLAIAGAPDDGLDDTAPALDDDIDDGLEISLDDTTAAIENELDGSQEVSLDGDGDAAANDATFDPRLDLDLDAPSLGNGAAKPERGNAAPAVLDTPWSDESPGPPDRRISELELQLSDARRDLEAQRLEAASDRAELARSQAALAQVEAKHRSLQARIDESVDQDREYEANLVAYKADAAMLPDLQDRVARLGEENARLGAELASTQGEASALRDRLEELEAGADEVEVLRRQKDSLEAEVERHEGRVIAAYQKLEAEVRLRTTIRKSLVDALHLLGTEPSVEPKEREAN